MKGGASYADYSSSGKTFNFEESAIAALRSKYNNATDEQIIDGKIGNGGGIQALNGGLNFIFKDGVIPWKGDSKLVGVRGDGIGSTLGSYADYTQPVFWTDSIYGQKGGSFWAMEDDITKLIAGARPCINVTPILNKDGNPYICDEKGRPEREEIDNYLEYSVPCKDESETYKRQKDGNNFCGAYLFKWAPIVGDSAYRTATQYGFISDETNNKKKGGKKRTNKRKMNKRKKTRRNNKNKRKTVKKIKN